MVDLDQMGSEQRKWAQVGIALAKIVGERAETGLSELFPDLLERLFAAQRPQIVELEHDSLGLDLVTLGQVPGHRHHYIHVAQLDIGRVQVQVGVDLEFCSRLDRANPTGLVEVEALIMVDAAHDLRCGFVADAADQGFESDDLELRGIHDGLKGKADVGADQSVVLADMLVDVKAGGEVCSGVHHGSPGSDIAPMFLRATLHGTPKTQSIKGARSTKLRAVSPGLGSVVGRASPEPDRAGNENCSNGQSDPHRRVK